MSDAFDEFIFQKKRLATAENGQPKLGIRRLRLRQAFANDFTVQAPF
ncbi:hypothetical protein [Xanthomonas albilineans]|nr:hypothetical protein [Xanthomonas albilineans]